MYFRHEKTGGSYEFLGLCIIEATWTAGVIYRAVGAGEDSIIRPAAEFFDGRFVVISEDEAYGITRDADGAIIETVTYEGTNEPIEVKNIFDDEANFDEDDFRHAMATHHLDGDLIESVIGQIKKGVRDGEA